MSDTAPVGTGKAGCVNSQWSQFSSVPRLSNDQSAYHHGGPQERRTDDGGDQFRPAAAPGPCCGSQRSDGAPVGEEKRYRTAVGPQEWTKQTGKMNDPCNIKLVQVIAPLSVPTNPACPGPSEATLKPAKATQRNLSESSSDSGCCASNAELKELYKENEGLRIRVRGVEVIREVLENIREELESEKKKSGKLETAIGNLQSRLHKAGFDTSVDLAEHEIFIPGHDRTFVNRLIIENGRLQKQLKEYSRNGDAVERKSELEKTLNEHVQHLQEELHKKEAKISTLETLIRSSDDGKTAKIIHLQDEGIRFGKELKDAEATCTILTTETDRCRHELAASQAQLSQVSKELATWQEKARTLEDKVKEVAARKMEEPTQKESNLTLADRLKIAEGQVEQLNKENTRLTEQLHEVIGMNTRWQRYNQQREAHVLKLTKTNHHQQSKITVLEQQHRDLEQTINGLNVMLQSLKEGQRKNTDAAIISLEQQVLQKEDCISELAEELTELKMYLQSSENERGIGQRQEDKAMIQTLQQQVKIYKDDFDQERKDRERLQGNIDIVRHRLKDTSRQLEQLKAREQQQAPRPQARPIYQPPRRLIARGFPPANYQDDVSLLTSDVEVDGVDERDGLGSNTEPLQCPRCAQEFEVSDHSLFMRHVGVCLDQ